MMRQGWVRDMFSAAIVAGIWGNDREEYGDGKQKAIP